MRTATVADLRKNFRHVTSWIELGESVRITKRGQAFALLAALPAGAPPPREKPDIMAQLREVWGDRVLSMVEVEATHEAELSGDEG